MNDKQTYKIVCFYIRLICGGNLFTNASLLSLFYAGFKQLGFAINLKFNNANLGMCIAFVILICTNDYDELAAASRP